jgi:hypothetical protein
VCPEGTESVSIVLSAATEAGPVGRAAGGRRENGLRAEIESFIEVLLFVLPG